MNLMSNTQKKHNNKPSNKVNNTESYKNYDKHKWCIAKQGSFTLNGMPVDEYLELLFNGLSYVFTEEQLNPLKIDKLIFLIKYSVNIISINKEYRNLEVYEILKIINNDSLAEKNLEEINLHVKLFSFGETRTYKKFYNILKYILNGYNKSQYFNQNSIPNEINLSTEILFFINQIIKHLNMFDVTKHCEVNNHNSVPFFYPYSPNNLIYTLNNTYYSFKENTRTLNINALIKLKTILLDYKYHKNNYNNNNTFKPYNIVIIKLFQLSEFAHYKPLNYRYVFTTLLETCNPELRQIYDNPQIFKVHSVIIEILIMLLCNCSNKITKNTFSYELSNFSQGEIKELFKEVITSINQDSISDNQDIELNIID